ncbi:MAG: hypothetical protein R3E50_16185 [Halioglobus sp.]
MRRDTRFPLIATFWHHCGAIDPTLLFLWQGLSVYWIFSVMLLDYGIKASLLMSLSARAPGWK